MQPTNCPGSIAPCLSTGDNCWTRSKESSAGQDAPGSAGNREDASTGKYILHWQECRRPLCAAYKVNHYW